MERKYVWLHTQEKDIYVEFKDVFAYAGGKAVVKITADYKYALYVNGEIVGSAQFADIPEYKTFSEYDVTEYLTKGENTLLVKAYHMSNGCSVCRVMTPCVSYEVVVDGEKVCVSSADTLCRKDVHYEVGDLFSRQIGDGYRYSFVEEELPWERCELVEPNFQEFPKPIKNTHLNSRKEGTVIAQGVYRLDGGETTAEEMKNSFITTVFRQEMMTRRSKGVSSYPMTFECDIEGDGLFILGDLGCECAGFPFLDVVCERDTIAYLGWGEHLADLRPRVKITYRNFAIQIKLKKGENHFADYMRRIGARYVWLFIADKKIAVNAMGVTEELYPLEKPKKDFGDKLLNRIYETGRRTLELCMHEHYEDCPWREQSFYGMDSRNQMLFGYGAFREYQFARASLSLIAKCLREDGLIPICPPSTFELVIPSFSAYWIMAICDNAREDFNLPFIQDVLPAVEKCLRTFMKKTHDKVLCMFGEKEYWNFHEWSNGLTGGWTFRDYSIDEIPDALLTAVVYRAARGVSELEKAVGNDGLSKELSAWADELAEGLYTFYDEEKGLFASYIKEGKLEGYHEYTQAMILSTGVLDEKKRERICDVLMKGAEGLVPLTLAALPIKYEALLEYADSAAYIKDNICDIFGDMLFKGATCYWEVAEGVNFEDGSGSLCHGWSAAPCYALDKIQKLEEEKRAKQREKRTITVKIRKK